VPWSVPPVPLAAAVRPNSVPTSTVVSAHAAPRPSRSAASIASSDFSRFVMRCACALCVSQPSLSSMAMRGPSGRARKLAARRPRSLGLWRGDGVAIARASIAVDHKACSCASSA
jgi:hypothetical protein